MLTRRVSSFRLQRARETGPQGPSTSSPKRKLTEHSRFQPTKADKRSLDACDQNRDRAAVTHAVAGCGSGKTSAVPWLVAQRTCMSELRSVLVGRPVAPAGAMVHDRW